ncbi:hypothetical protein LguiA_011755 [Lonicera macranthoides]
MSCKVFTGTQSSFHFLPNPTQSSTTTSSLQSCTRLSFKTHLPKTRISIKFPSGSNRTRRNSAIKSLYATAQSTETFYELLGIPESVSLPEIKRAYKQLARKYHPDVSPPGRTEEYTRTFIRVQEAYETLSDPNTRALYDMDMSQGLHLAFSARKRDQYDQRTSEWMNRWQSQIVELNRRSKIKNSRGNNASWGDRMRRQRSESFVNGFE